MSWWTWAWRNDGSSGWLPRCRWTLGLHGFRSFAIDKPHLFRLTFERVPAEVLTDPAVVAAAVSGYKVLVHRIERAQAAGVVADRPAAEIAFALHSLCQGMAGGELARKPPPVGSNFWWPVQGIDAQHLWRTGLEALVAGFAPS